MKKQLIAISLVILTVSCNDQNISKQKVPSLVVNTLQQQFPFSNDVEWEKHGSIYEEEFLNDRIEMSAQIDENGKIIMQKQEISNADLQSDITTIINSHYKNYNVDEVEKVEKSGAVYFQVELKNGKKEFNLIFSSDGKEAKNVTYWD